jgi:hypothetical protein
LEIRLELSDASSSAGPRMEPLWSPVVANGGNRRQIEESRKPQKQAKTVAVDCQRLPATFHGKEGVDGSSPVRGLSKGQQMAFFVASSAYAHPSIVSQPVPGSVPNIPQAPSNAA